MLETVTRLLAVVCVLLLNGCERRQGNEGKGASQPDTAFGDVPEHGQVPGQGRMDRGGGATAGGFEADSQTNYTQPGSGVQKPPGEKDSGKKTSR